MRVRIFGYAGVTCLYLTQIGLVAAGDRLGRAISIEYLSQLVVWVWVAFVWQHIAHRRNGKQP